MNIRPGEIADAGDLRRLDHVAAVDSRRCELIDGAIARGECFVVEVEGGIAGYGILNYSFFHCAFVELLYIRQELRRRGLGRFLLEKMEEMCRTSKLFVSTNASNVSRIVYSQSFIPGVNSTADQYGHGTHVAGIVAGNATASTGSGSSSIEQGE